MVNTSSVADFLFGALCDLNRFKLSILDLLVGQTYTFGDFRSQNYEEPRINRKSALTHSGF